MVAKGTLYHWIGATLAAAFFVGIFVMMTSEACGCSGPEGLDLSNVKQWALANTMYMADNDGEGAVPSQWMDQLSLYIGERGALRRPNTDDPEVYGYAFLDALGRVRDADVAEPVRVPAVFDSHDLSKNAHGTLALLPNPPLWGSANMVGFLDGHAKAVRAAPSYSLKTTEPTP